MNEATRLSTLQAFLSAVGAKITDDDALIQHLVYIARATEFKALGLAYDFNWPSGSKIWPFSADLQNDIAALRARPLPIDLTTKLTEHAMGHVKRHVVPLLDAQYVPYSTWVSILAKIHCMVTDRGHEREEAVEVVFNDYFLAKGKIDGDEVAKVEGAVRAAEARLGRYGWLQPDKFWQKVKAS